MIEMSWEKLAADSGYRPCQLATICKVSLRTLQRHFTAKYGMTLSEWLRQVRLRQAYVRIQSGERIKSVAYDLGFKQLSHFSRVFRQVYGVPPSAIAAPTPEFAQLLSIPAEGMERAARPGQPQIIAVA